MHPRSRPSLALVVVAAVLLALAGTADPARAQGLFGKNKVVYERLEWQVLRTEHVEVFFYSQEEELARTLAAIAESTCAELDTTFRMRPRKRIPILTYSSHQAFQQTNATPGFISEGTGGLTELIKGRVLIPHTGSHHRLVWVTRHELVHAYMLEKIAQEQKEAKKYRGAWPPLWFTEGLAEFISTRWDATAEGLLQDAVVNGVALPVTRSWDIEGTVLMYKEGQSFLEFAAERYGGRRRVMDLFEHWAEGSTFSEIWEKTFDEKLADVDEAWFASLKRRYYPRVATRRPVKEIARAVTCCGQTFDLAPTVLPAAPGDSALRLAYLSAEDGSVSLRLRVERGGKLVSDERVLRGGFSPRFESFHFFRSRLGASRDGRLAIVAQQGGRDVLHVVVPETGKVIHTWSFPGIIGLASPTWVAGDTTLVVVGQAVSGRTDLYRVRVADGTIAALTDDGADDDDPTAHPTRPLVVFASDRESGTRGDHALFSLDLVSGAIEPMTSGPADDRRPVWSPDGTTLAFLSDREGIDDLWLWREGRLQRASRFLGPAYDPEWHPDGTKLLFAGQAGWSFHLYEVPVTPVDSLWVDEDPRAGLAGHPEPVRSPEAPGPYPRRLSMDIAQSLVALDPALGAGGGGGLVALSDVLGNEGLYLFLSNDASSLGGFLDGMEFGVTYFNRSQRLNYGVGVFRLARIYDVDFDLFRRERRIGATFMAAYPLSKFTRLEASTVVRYAQDHLLRSDGEFRDLWLLSNFFAFVHDDARFTFYGAEGGHRVNVTAGFTRDLSTGTGDDVSLTLDGRVYRSLVKDVVWANRVVTQASTGDDPQTFYLGGPYTIRGWDRRVLWGTKTASVQTELRFPILARTRLGAPLPIEFPRVNVALFADAAVAGEFGQPFEKRGAVGAGLFVGGGYFPVLRLDFVKRSDLRTIEPKTRTQFSIGYSF